MKKENIILPSKSWCDGNKRWTMLPNCSKMCTTNESIQFHYQFHQYNVPTSMENQSRKHKAFATLPAYQQTKDYIIIIFCLIFFWNWKQNKDWTTIKSIEYENIPLLSGEKNQFHREQAIHCIHQTNRMLTIIFGVVPHCREQTRLLWSSIFVRTNCQSQQDWYASISTNQTWNSIKNIRFSQTIDC